MAKEISGNLDPSDEELKQVMEEVGKLVAEESLKVKQIHEQRLKEIFSVKESGEPVLTAPGEPLLRNCYFVIVGENPAIISIRMMLPKKYSAIGTTRIPF